MRYKVSLIGSGNVAWNLAHALDKYGHTIVQVVSKHEEHARELAERFGAYYGTEHSDLYGEADILFICVNDDSYAEVVQGLKAPADTIVCHTSGPMPMSVLDGDAKKYGVFYPLQSLNKSRLKDFLEVPLLVEGSDPQVERTLRNLAEQLSNHVSVVSSEDRMRYHVAAVFSNNFANLMYVCSEMYLDRQGLDFNMLKPLIYETALKLKDDKPSKLQTGPAKRHDHQVIAKHLELLDDEKLKEIYEQLSKILMTLY